MDAIPQSIWYKLRYTPLRDALRGTLSGRLDLRRPLEASGLPPEVQQILRRIVRRTGLWRLEKLEVTQELIAHFTDGMASGLTADQLIKGFGNETQAAKLIRRAKRRNRPLPWQIARVVGLSMSALLVFYSGYAIYFFAGRPSPRVNYVANINREIEKTPIEDRAWPLYRRALVELGPVSDWELRAHIGSKAWPRLVQVVREHQTEIEWIRQGAAKPTFGFLVGAGGSAHDAELWPDLEASTVDPVIGEPLFSSAFPPIGHQGNLAALIRADATLGRQEKDGKRVLRDLHALLGLSRQVGENAPLLWALVSVSIYDHALQEIGQTLRENPALLDTRDWIGLAQQLSKPKFASDLITFDKERMWVDDMLQRAYTDDGSGNGRLTREGVQYFDASLNGRDKRLWEALHPVVGLLVPSRKKLAQEHTQFYERVSTNMKLPIRDADWQSVQNDLESRRSFLDSINPFSIVNFSPSFQRSQQAAEQVLGHRDGIVVGIALEIYRREHGSYPQSLDVLVPHYIPDVPFDRISGDRVRYRIVDGRPVVYSVGADRNDDGGRGPSVAAIWIWANRDVSDGDWILYSADVTARGQE